MLDEYSPMIVDVYGVGYMIFLASLGCAPLLFTGAIYRNSTLLFGSDIIW
jgi:hypothetical protein